MLCQYERLHSRYLFVTLSLAGLAYGCGRVGRVQCAREPEKQQHPGERRMSTPIWIGLLMFSGMLVLMGLRVPIAAAMFVPGALGLCIGLHGHAR